MPHHSAGHGIEERGEKRTKLKKCIFLDLKKAEVQLIFPLPSGCWRWLPENEGLSWVSSLVLWM